MANALEATKSCTHCGEEKSLSYFSKERSTSNIYRSYCKPCAVKRVQKKRENDTTWWRKYQLKRDFGMTLHQYEQMLEEQAYRCAICNNLFDVEVQARKPNLDHDHKTGRVRGVLCFGCNTTLGKVGDSIDTLRNAIAYLEKHSNE